MARQSSRNAIAWACLSIVANAGGAVGVWTHLADTPLEFAHNIRALVDVIGVDQVCIGTDTKLSQPSSRPGGTRPGGSGPGGPPSGGRRPSQQGPRVGERTNQAWGYQAAGFYYLVVDAMLNIGFTSDEIGKIGGGNFLRIFGEALVIGSLTNGIGHVARREI